MPKLDPKKVKDFPIGTAEGNTDIVISCRSAWSGHDFDQDRGIVKVYFHPFIDVLPKEKPSPPLPFFPKKQQHFPQLTLLPEVLSALSDKPVPLFALRSLDCQHSMNVKKALRGNQLFLFECKSQYCSGNRLLQGLFPTGSPYSYLVSEFMS